MAAMQVPMRVSTFQAAVTMQRTGGRSCARSDQLIPRSSERNTFPPALPKAAESPAATRQWVSMLAGNHSGRPWWRFSKGWGEPKGLR